MTQHDTCSAAVDSHDPVVLTDGLTVEEVHARLAACLRLRDVGQRGLAFYLEDMHRRKLHDATGHSSTVWFAQARLGLSRRRAHELIAIGRALRELPRIDAAFCRGKLIWSKVVLLTRVATPRHEQAWLERALNSTCRELRVAVRRANPGEAPRGKGNTKGLPGIRYDVHARLGDLAHRKLQLAKEKLSAERGVAIDDATFIEHLCDLLLETDDDGSLPGRQRIDGSLYRIVLHAGHECTDGENAAPTLTLDTPDGPVPIPGEAPCLLCDGECTSSDGGHPAEALDVATPPALRRCVLARDGFCCRACGGRHHLMVHHIHFRSRGGRTMASNLITLCAHCHALVHEDLLVLTGTHAERITLCDADGKPLEGGAPPSLPKGMRMPLAAPPPWPERFDDTQEAPAAPPEPLDFDEAFAGIVGQESRLARLRWLAEGSRARGRPFPHSLFTGPAGTGKTTFARALAAHAGKTLVQTSGPALSDVEALQAALRRVKDGGLLFIDEIHAMPRRMLEHLYEAMTPSAEGPGEQRCAFTLLAATTEQGELPGAMRSRFGLTEALGFHDEDTLVAIARARAATALTEKGGCELSETAARRLAACARGTPREVIRLVERVVDWAAGQGTTHVDQEAAECVLGHLGFDAEGLDPLARRYLETLQRQQDPVSLGRLASMLGVAVRTLLDCVEPYLCHLGLVRVTRRGRVAVPRRPHLATSRVGR